MCQLCVVQYWNSQYNRQSDKKFADWPTSVHHHVAENTQFGGTCLESRWVADFWKKKKYIYYQGWSPWHRRRSRCSKPENVNRACYSLEIVVVFDLLGCLVSKPCFNLNFSNPPNWGILIEIEICNDCKNYNWNANWNFVNYRYIEV